MACGDDSARYRFGENITGIQFELFDPSEGIHPSDVTLNNPRNPFRQVNISDNTKFDILTDGGNAGAFYAWATLLAKIPIGENQYYTATKLRDIFLSGEVAQEDSEVVRQMAIGGCWTVSRTRCSSTSLERFRDDSRPSHLRRSSSSAECLRATGS